MINMPQWRGVSISAVHHTVVRVSGLSFLLIAVLAAGFVGRRCVVHLMDGWMDGGLDQHKLRPPGCRRPHMSFFLYFVARLF